MRFLIDGYNLMHLSGLAEKSRSWTANRNRFLDWLTEQIPANVEWKVVFDAQKMNRLKTVQDRARFARWPRRTSSDLHVS